jgi:RNA polymerase sigma factor (sigma-70 family)
VGRIYTSPTTKAGKAGTFLHLFSTFLPDQTAPTYIIAGSWGNFLRFVRIRLATAYFNHYVFAMSSGDSVPQQSDDLVFSDAVLDTKNEEGAEPEKNKSSAGWTDFEHSLQSLKDRDSDAWNEFVIRQNEIAENVILGSFSGKNGKVSKEDAQDMAADLYIKLGEKIGEFQTLEAVGAWFVEALKHDALDLIKKKKAAKHGGGKVVSLDAGRGNEPTDKFSRAAEYTNAYHKLHDKNFDWEISRQRNPGEQAELDDVLRQMESCIQQLKPNERQFIECQRRQLIHKQIAEECGCGTSEVGIRLKRIHQKLAKMLRTIELTEEKE